MKALVIMFVVIIISVTLGSLVYLFKNKMFSKIKTYSTLLLISGFLISCALPLYSFHEFKEIKEIENRISKYTEQEYRSKFQDEDKIKVEKFTIVRANFINFMVLVCTVQYIYTLHVSIRVKNLEQKKRAKENMSLPQKA